MGSEMCIRERPDTGCSITIIAYRVAKRENLIITNNSSVSLSTATGQSMDISGLTKLNAQANGIKCTISALVSKDLQEDIVISCSDLKTLKVIPKGFPTEICRAIETKDIQDALLNAYTDIISDELNPIPMQTGKNMHISLIDKCKPFKICLLYTSDAADE